MQIVIKWDLEALERVAKKVQQIEGNPTRLLKSIGQTLLNRNEDRHDAEKGPVSSVFLYYLTPTEPNV